MTFSTLIILVIFLLTAGALANSQLTLAQEPTATHYNCFLTTVANLPAQSAPVETCLQLGLPTSLSIPGIGDLVVSIIMPNQDTQLCPTGTTAVSSETAETPLILCMSIS